MTTAIIGGHNLGLLDGSLSLLNRNDRTSNGTLGHGEQAYANVSNGDLILQQRDAFLPSRGADFDLVRTYNSRAKLAASSNWGWSWSTGVTLSRHNDTLAGQSGNTDAYIATYGDGSSAHFDFDATKNLWVSTDGAGAYETLRVLNGNGTGGIAYVLTRADQTQFNFDKNFTLLSSVDTNSVRMDYEYQANRLVRVRDDTGHVLTFTYASNNLVSIADESNVTLVQYGYTNGRLTSVTDRDGHVTTFAYNGSSHLLESMTLPDRQTDNGQLQQFDQRQIRFTYQTVAWDDHPHVNTDFDAPNVPALTEVLDAMGGRTTFDYGFTFGSSMVASDRDVKFQVGGNRFFTGGTTRVVDAMGNGLATSNAPEFQQKRVALGFAADSGVLTQAQKDTLRQMFSLTYRYDADGYITEVTDQQGFKTTYSYDAKDNLTSIVDRNGFGATNSDAAYYRSLRADLGYRDAGGNGKLVADLSAAEETAILAKFTTSFTYDANGNLISRTDNAGNLTTYTYTAFNKIASETAAMGNALASSDNAIYQQKRTELGFSDSLAGLTQAQKDALKALYTTTYTYDAKQNLIERKDPGGDLTRFEHDAFGNLSKKTVFLDPTDLVTPAKQQVTQYFYDAFGNNVETVDGQGSHTFRTFDHFGNVLTSIDGRGGVTTNTYDADNRLLTTTDPEGHTIVNAFDAVGNKISITDANGHTVTQIFDKNNLLVGTIDPAATAALTRNTTFKYDILGNRTEVTDAEGRKTTYTFDARRQLVDVATPQVLNGSEQLVAYHTTYAYDGEGNLVTRTDNNGNVTQLLYTTSGLLKRETNPIGNVTEYLYDANLAQIQITIGAQLGPALRRVLRFSRDEENQTVVEVDALGNTTRSAYDAPGNVVSVTDANGHKTDYQYDKNNRLVKETRPEVIDPTSGQPIRYTVLHQYDANGNEIATTDENGYVTTVTFDKDDRQAMVTDGNGTKTVYSYDSRDNQTRVAIGVQAHVDANGTIAIDDASQASVTSFVYDEFNQLIAATDGVGNALAASDLPLYQRLRTEMGFAPPVADLSAADKTNLLNRFTERYEYDRVGNRTKVTDHLGRVSSQQYDALNRLQSRTEAQGISVERTSAFRYDGNANLVKLTDALRRVTRYTYDGADRLVNETDPLGVVTHHEYDDVGNVTADTEAFGTPEARTTRYVYDLNDRLIEEADPEGHVKRYEYDAVGNRLKEIDARGGVTQLVYDALNRNIRIIDPLSFETRLEYDGVGNNITIVDANGGIERLQYDGANRYIQTTDPEGRITRFEYDVLDNVVTQTTALGLPEAQVTRYVYDAESILRQITDAAGNVSTQGFDDLYNLTRFTDNNGNITTTAYDALNRRIQVTDPLGGVTTYTYDLEDNQLSETDPLGRVRTFAYDANDRLIVQTDALGVETHYAYDAVGNQVTITRAADTATPKTNTFVYDKDDRLVSQTDALGNVTTYQYDANNNVISTTDALGRVTTYAYDLSNQVTSITDPLGHVTQYVYDGKGNRVQVIDARGNAQTTYYNLNDEVILTVDGEGFAVGTSHDGNGNLVSTTEYMTRLAGSIDPEVLPTPAASPQDRTTTYQYDALNRLVAQTDALGGVTTSAYDAVGNRTSETDENGHTTTYGYDDNDRRISQTNPLGGVRNFTYDALGNLLTDTDENGHTTGFVYDAEDRLIRETDPVGGIKTYTYDAVNNLLSQTDQNAHTRSYVYDLEDRLIQETNPLGGIKTYSYDAVGNQLTATDENGHTTTFAYDADDRLVSQTNALGHTRRTTYDAVDNVVSETDENGHTITYAYDKNNRLISETDPRAGVTTYTWDAAGNQLSEADANGHLTTYAYDKNDRLLSETNPLGGVKSYTYDAVGSEISATDENGHTISSAYDANDRLVSVTDALGGVRSFTYDAAGNQLTEADENGHVTTFVYDANDRQVKQTDPLGGERTQTYDAVGNKLTETDAEGRTTTFAYDVNDRLVTQTDALGGIRSFAYDAVGNQLTATDEAGRVTTFVYDANDQLTSQTDPLNGVQTFTYDHLGNQLTHTDEAGRVTTLVYDETDRLISQTNALGGVRTIAYDAVGNQITQTDENGHSSHFVYDANDRLIGQTDPLGGQRTFTYDGAGNQLSETDENGHTTTFAYDPNDRLIKQTDALGGERTFTYDAVGNQLTETDENDHTITRAYDALDRLLSETDALGGVKTYAYDRVDNLLTQTDENGHLTAFAYDALNRRVSQTDALGAIRSFTYDAVGNQRSETDENGHITTFAYDRNDRLIKQTDPLTGVREFTYDAVGNRLTEKNENGAITTFVYDANDRLTSQADALNGVRSFTYDAVGNRLTETDENGRALTFAYDASDRLASATDALGGVRSYTYDAAGNQVSETDENGHTKTTAYDANDRVISETDALGHARTYTYDGVGNRLSDTDENDHTTTFAYDAIDRLASQTNALGATRSFTYDAAGNQLTDTDENGHTTTSSYDANNRLLHETDALGAHKDYTYDAAGNQLTEADENGKITSFEYDANDRVTKQTDPLGASRSFTYDTVGNRLSETDENGHTTTSVYDADNRLIQQIDPVGGTKTFAYDAVDNITVETDQNGHAVTTVYDANDRIASETNALGQVTRFFYDAVGNNTQVENPLGDRITNYFDAANQLVMTVDAEGVVLENEFDAAGSATKQTLRARRVSVPVAPDTPPVIVADAKDEVIQYRYDVLNRLIETEDAEGGIAGRTYDAAGNQLTQSDANGNVTTYTYDANDRLASETNALNETKTFTYDAAGNTLIEVDAAGRTTSYTYDGNNRLLTETNPLGGVRTLTYDGVGNQLTEVDETVRTTTFGYDANDRVISEQDSAEATKSYTYDAIGNRVTETDETGRTTTFVYNEINLVTSDTDPLGNTRLYRYDENNNATETEDAAGIVNRKTYDRSGQVVTETDGLGNSTHYVYDAAGNQVTITDPKGQDILFYFDRSNRVILMVDAEGFATSTSYDDNGNVLSVTVHATALSGPLDPDVLPTVITSADDRTTSYTYDTLNRVSNQTDARGVAVNYAYDNVGNQILRTQDSSAPITGPVTDFNAAAAAVSLKIHDYYDINHRRIATLTSEGVLTTYEYDAAGREVVRTEYLAKYTAPADGLTPPMPLPEDLGRKTITAYDAAGRKDTETGPTGLVTKFQYDAAGREQFRIEAFGTSQARTTESRYDGAGRILETVDPAGTVTHYVLDEIGRVAEKHEAFGLSEVRITKYEYDANDRVTAQIDASEVRTEYTYNNNGQLTSRKTAAGIAGVERTETFIYDNAGFLAEQINGEGEHTTFEYDGGGNRTKITVAPGTTAERVLLFKYDGNNKLIEETDGNGAMTKHVYDGAGNKIETIQAANRPGLERSTLFAYDTDNRLVSVTNPEGGVTSYQYDAVGNQTKITDPNGAVTINTYDALGRLASSTSGAGGPHGGVKVVNTYDLFGNIVATTQSFADDTQASTTTYEYDVLDRQTVVTDGEGFSSEFAYDRFGNQVEILRGTYRLTSADPGFDDAKPARVHVQATAFEYDELDRLVTSTDGEGNKVVNTYDARGNRLAQTTAAGTASAATVTFTYDFADRVVQKTTPTGGRVKLEYDEAGNQIAIETLQSSSGTAEVVLRITFTYDDNGRTVEEIDPFGTITRHEIDVYGNETGIVFAFGTDDERAARSEFDANGNKVADIDAMGKRTENVVDAVGNRIKQTDPLGRVTHFYYDVYNQQVAELDPEGFLTTYVRDPDGNITETRVFLNRYTAPADDLTPPTASANDPVRILRSTIDRAGNLVAQTSPDGSVKEYERDSTGLLIKQTNRPSDNEGQLEHTADTAAHVLTFEYDDAGRLTRFVNANGVEETYAYDAAGNRIRETIHNPSLLAGGRTDPDRTTTFSYDLDNRLVSQVFDNAGGEQFTQVLSYDFVGNVISKTDANGNSTTSNYDLNNRPVETIDATGATVHFGYDLVGNQTSITDAKGNRTDFVYDAANRQTQQLLPSAQNFAIAGNVPTIPAGGFDTLRPTTTTTYDAVGNVVQVLDANGNKTTSYYDGNNNKIAEVNADLALRTFTYDATGALVTATQHMTRLNAGDPATHDPNVLPTPPVGSEARTVTSEYDAEARVIRTSYPQVSVTTLSGTDTSSPSATENTVTPEELNFYDAFGNLVESVDRNGNHSFAYFDSVGRQIAAVDKAGFLTETDYDSQGHVVQQRRYRTALDISEVSAAVKPTVPLSDAFVVDRVYDAASRLIAETSPPVKVGELAGEDVFERVRTVFTYDANGNQTGRTVAEGTADAATEFYYYDGANRRVAVVTAGRTLNTFQYDLNGNKTSQTRFMERVPGTVDLADAELATVIDSVTPDVARDQTTLYTYDALDRLTSQSDVIIEAGETTNDAANDITTLTAYDSMGNVTRRVDAEGNVSQMGYDGVGNLTQTLTPNGGASFVEYDTGGLKTRAWTGGLPNQSAQQATNVSASIGGSLNISWTQPGGDSQSWVVWDTSAHDIEDETPDQVYPNQTGRAGSGLVSADIPLTGLPAGTIVYFRVVSQDSAGNIAWTEERTVTIATQVDSLAVERSGSDLRIRAHFNGAVTDPVFKFGPAGGTLTSTAPFALQADGTYVAVIANPSDPQALAFAIEWQVGGDAFATSAITFEAGGTHNAVQGIVGIDLPQVNGAPISNSQLVLVNGQGNTTGKRVNAQLQFDPQLTTNGTHRYDVFYGNLQSTDHTVAMTSHAHQSTVQNGPDTVNTDQDGNTTSVVRHMTWEQTYETHVEATLGASETVSGTVHAAFKTAGSGITFPDDVALTLASGKYTGALNLDPGDYDVKIYYVNTSGKEVVVEWRRITVSEATLPADFNVTDNTSPFTFAGQESELNRTVNVDDPAGTRTFSGKSLEVLASETDGSIVRQGSSPLDVDAGLYVGALDPRTSGAVTVDLGTSDSSGAGSLSTDGFQSQTYFTEIRYNALGDRVATNEDSGVWRAFGVDANGNAVVTNLYGTPQDEIADKAGEPGHEPIVSFTAYDALDREAATFDAAAVDQRAVTRTTYDFDSRIASVLEPGDTQARTFEYDGAGNVIKSIDPLNQGTRRIYNRRGDEVEVIDPNGNSITKAYDLQSNLVSETDGVGNATTHEYDAFKRRVATINPLNQQSTMRYDQHDRLVSVIDLLGNLTNRYYDKRDNEIWLQDANGHWFGHGYDAMGRQTHEYSFMGGSPTDLASAQAALSSADPLNEFLIVNSKTHDVFGNKILETDANGRREISTYGPFGRLTERSKEDITFLGEGAAPIAFSETTEYDRFGGAIRETSTQGKNIERTNDAAGRLVEIDDQSTGVRTTYTYYINGQRATEKIFAAGDLVRDITYTYDANDRMTRWADAAAGKDLNYTFDAADNVVRVHSDDLSVDHTYTYDASNRVATFDKGAGENTFTYDAAANRISWNGTDGLRTYTYDDGGRVLEERDSNGTVLQSWTYDDVGNVLEYVDSTSGETKTTSNTFLENNLISATTSDGQTTTTEFDKTGRTLSQSVVSDDQNFTYTFDYNRDGTQRSVTGQGDGAAGSSFSTYDANQHLIELNLGQGDNQDSAEFRRFTYNNDGQILSRLHDDGKDGTPNPTTQFLYANGNPAGEVDDQGAMVLDEGAYDPVKIINSDFPTSSVTGYTVRAGDTLQSIATLIYGNPSLWFVIAEANGLTGSEQLREGMQLEVPNTVQNGRITHETHAVYSEGDIVGSKLPNLKSPPPPPSSSSSSDNCAVIAAIILVVVVAILAVVITIVTVGLAAPAAAAALGVTATSAAGIIIGVAVGAAIGAAVAFTASVITQGILIGFGLQQEFDWKQVAADTVAGAFGGATGGLGKLIEAGRLAGTLARTAVAVASTALEAAGEAARQAIANDGHIDAPWAIALAGVGGAFGALTTRATRIARTVDDAGKTILKVVKKAPAGTVIKGVKGKTVTVFDAAGKKFVLKSADVKLVKTAEGQLRIVKRVGDSISRGEKVRRAFLKTFGVGRTVSKADDGTKVIKSFELQKVSGKGRSAIFKEVLVEKTVTRQALQKGKSIKVDKFTKLRLVDGQITNVRRVSDQYTRAQRISRFFSQTFNKGKFASRTISKGKDDGLKTVSRIELAPSGTPGVLQETRVIGQTTRTALLKGKKIILGDRVKLRLIDGQIEKVRRVSDQFSRTQRLQRLLGIGEFALDKTVAKTAKAKFVREAAELRPIKSGPLKGVLEERQIFVKRARDAIGAVQGGPIVRRLDKAIKPRLVGDELRSVRRISDQYTTAERVERRLGRAFNVGEYAAKRTVSKSDSTGLKKVVTFELRKSKTLQGVLEERSVRRTVFREGLTTGKKILQDGGRTKLRLINGKVQRVQRVSDQYGAIQRVQRRVGVGEFKIGKTYNRFAATETKLVRSGSELTKITSGPLTGALQEQPLVRIVSRKVLVKGGSIKIDARVKKVLIDGKIVKVQRLSDQYQSRARRVQRSLGRFFNVGEFATSTTTSKTAKFKKVRTFQLREIQSGPLKGQNVFREKAVITKVRRLSSQGLAKRQIAAEAVKNFFSTAGTKLRIGGKKAGVFLSDLVNAGTDFAPADLFAKAGNKGSNARVLTGWVGSVGIPVGGVMALGITYPYEDHPPGPMGYLIKAGVVFGKSLAAYASGGGDSSDAPGAAERGPFSETVALPTLNVVLNGHGEGALRKLGYGKPPEPIELHDVSVPPSDQFNVRDAIELYDAAHGKRHHWLPVDWVKTAAAATTRIFSPFALDRGVSYQESLSANHLVTGQVAQYARDTVQRFTQGSVGRVPNNTIPIELLDNSVPATPKVA